MSVDWGCLVVVLVVVLMVVVVGAKRGCQGFLVGVCGVCYAAMVLIRSWLPSRAESLLF